MHNEVEKPLCVIFFKEMLLPFRWRRLIINIFFSFQMTALPKKKSLYYVVNFDNYVVYIAFRGRNMDYLQGAIHSAILDPQPVVVSFFSNFDKIFNLVFGYQIAGGCQNFIEHFFISWYWVPNLNLIFIVFFFIFNELNFQEYINFISNFNQIL